MSAARDMAEYVADAFFSYEAMRDARDEALTRCCELEAQRDQARRIAVELEQENARLTEGAAADPGDPACWADSPEQWIRRFLDMRGSRRIAAATYLRELMARDERDSLGGVS